ATALDAAAAATHDRRELVARETQRGQQSEEQCGDDGHAEGCYQNASVQRDLLDARNTGRRERGQQTKCARREQHAEYTAREREYEAFREQLPHDGAAARAERTADRVLLHATGTARKRCAREVRACYEQYEHGCAQQDPERATRVPYECVVQTLELHAEREEAHCSGVAGDARILIQERARDRVQLRFRRRERCAGCEARDRRVVVRGSVVG